MSRASAGGRNKTHGQAERTPRLDSFEIGRDCGGSVEIGNTLTETEFLDYAVYYKGDSENVQFWYKGAPLKEDLTITRKQNGFGGSQVFFLCPVCGQRVRFLYLSRGAFRCRKCSRLNYRRSQQSTVDSMFWYQLGMEYAREHFAPPPFLIDGFSFGRWTPERKRYQHNGTYQKHLARFRRYQLYHSEKMKEELAAILGEL